MPLHAKIWSSSLLNTVAPVRWASVSSTFGRGCTSISKLSFEGIKVGTDLYTAGLLRYHDYHVGSSTLLMTPMDSILASSLGCSGNATWQGVNNACGLVSDLSLMTNSSPKFLRPLNTFGK